MSRGTLSSDKTASVLDGLELMTLIESGASIVTSLGRLVGIFTEREVVRSEIY
jgi:CBS domain-containing protein